MPRCDFFVHGWSSNWENSRYYGSNIAIEGGMRMDGPVSVFDDDGCLSVQSMRVRPSSKSSITHVE